jgi:hypothetical protein
LVDSEGGGEQRGGEGGGGGGEGGGEERGGAGGGGGGGGGRNNGGYGEMLMEREGDGLTEGGRYQWLGRCVLIEPPARTPAKTGLTPF